MLVHDKAKGQLAEVQTEKAELTTRLTDAALSNSNLKASLEQTQSTAARRQVSSNFLHHTSLLIC